MITNGSGSVMWDLYATTTVSNVSALRLKKFCYCFTLRLWTGKFFYKQADFFSSCIAFQVACAIDVIMALNHLINQWVSTLSIRLAVCQVSGVLHIKHWKTHSVFHNAEQLKLIVSQPISSSILFFLISC